MTYDISRLRKERGMSQNELARRLQITQSFLSAIENGKSPLPPEKEEKIIEIFDLENLEAYRNENGSNSLSAGKFSDMTDSDLFNQLLQRFHQQAHSREDNHHHHEHHNRIEQLQHQVERLFERNDSLMERNDSLAAANDRLREENDRLRSEIDVLRSEIFSLKKIHN